MKNLDVQLSEAVVAMKPETRKKFAAKTTGEKLPIESLVNIAESMLSEDGGDRNIRRNNGSHGSVSEADQRLCNLQESQMKSYMAGGFDESTARSMAGIEAVSESKLTGTQRADYQFCKLIGLSESDSLAVATSRGGIRE